MDTELARAVDVMMARAKRIYILMIKVHNLFSFFSTCCFVKEIENTFSVFLASYKNTHESLRELEKAVETLTCSSCSTAFLILSNYQKHKCVSITRWKHGTVSIS